MRFFGLDCQLHKRVSEVLLGQVALKIPLTFIYFENLLCKAKASFSKYLTV